VSKYGSQSHKIRDYNEDDYDYEYVTKKKRKLENEEVKKSKKYSREEVDYYDPAYVKESRRKMR
jgi:hypothetical protein